MWTRRELLALAAGVGTSSVAAARPNRGGFGGAWFGGLNEREGVFTDAFTYRRGEQIPVFAALHSRATVDVTLARMHGASARVVVPMTPGSEGRVYRPGVLGAGFDLAGWLPTDDLPPGVYQLWIHRDALLPENQRNLYHRFPSDNWYQRIVITEPEPGAHSRLLWVHDSLTGTAYGSYGGQSIYGSPAVRGSTVSWRRPGTNRTTKHWTSLELFEANGYAFEFVDLVALDEAPAEFLDAYDLVVMFGQFEYMPNRVISRLDGYLAGGGNLFAASNEFGAFRVRLPPRGGRLITYRDRFVSEDPLWGKDNPYAEARVAGVGMQQPGVVWETQVIGQTLWAAFQGVPTTPDLPIYAHPEAAWILEGTGLGNGDALPGALPGFTSGNLLEFGPDGMPLLIERDRTLCDPDTIVWGALHAPTARAWWSGVGDRIHEWPIHPSGYTTATYQQRASGAEVVTLPTQAIPKRNIGNPVYEQLLLNILARLAG